MLLNCLSIATRSSLIQVYSYIEMLLIIFYRNTYSGMNKTFLDKSFQPTGSDLNYSSLIIDNNKIESNWYHVTDYISTQRLSYGRHICLL